MFCQRVNAATTHKEFIMKVQAYITFAGRCEEALAFYKTAVGAEVTSLLRWKDSPDASRKGPPSFGMLTAQFGVPWMLGTAAAKA